MSALLEPIEGVSIDVYAGLQAARASGSISQEEFVEKLNTDHNLDWEKFGRIEKGWNDRMSADATGGVATAYGMAYSAAATGKFAMTAGHQSASKPSAVQEEAPPIIPFEKYCEIQGAQQAWAETGQDVNAMLHETFHMNANDWSNVSSFFSKQFVTDWNMAFEFQELTAKYKTQYKGSSSGSADDDIEF